MLELKRTLLTMSYFWGKSDSIMEIQRVLLVI
jgi:hypothetical protein